MLAYILFKVVPSMLVSTYTIYLGFVVYNKEVYKSQMERHKDNAKLYERIYTRQFFGVWVCMSLIFLTSVISDIFESRHTQKPLFLYVFYFFIFFAASIGIYMFTVRSKK